MNKMKLICLSLVVFSNVLFASGVGLSTDDVWDGTNRQKLNLLINKYGKNSPGYDAHHKPVAAFDWDNTMMRNDIGEATLLWMASHGKLKRPQSFSQMNPWLSSAALHELEKNCGGTTDYLPTQDKPACADTLLDIYHNLNLSHGAAAWKTAPHAERIFPPYFFYAQLFAGYTPEELSKFTKEALTFNLANEIGAKQKIGNKEYAAYVRIYSQMKNLVSVLKENGFDVWIISASIQPSVEVVANEVGIDKDHVIGVRQVLNSKGQVTDSFQGCGPFPDRNKEIISNSLGKRCWLNKIVFGVKDPQKMLSPAPVVFAAGDSAGDVVFLKDATGGRLVINKSSAELFCDAYANADGKWIINPMFIEPKVVSKDDYKCDRQ